VDYRWEFAPADDGAAERLQQELRIHPVFCRLLVQRGVQTFEQARSFFRPSLDDLHDPLLLRDMDRAVERLDRALRQEETVLVYGDYDVDGTTAVALVYHYLSRLGARVHYYLPDRDKEGYGVSEAGVRHGASLGASLLITLDCGIKALEPLALAASLGMDVIVADHHLPGSELPAACAVLDPRREDCSYPYPDLCGCGVGFKLLQALWMHRGLDLSELWEGLDLVAVAIAADIVPITGENRVMTYFGLKRLADAPRPGLAALLAQAGVRGQPGIRDLVFGLAPRINAAGRMGHAGAAVDMLLASAVDGAMDGAGELHRRNDLRKQEDRLTTQEALEQMALWPQGEERYSTVVFAEHWHKGVIGIVASRLIERHYRPTVVLTRSGHQWVGSARSVSGFDVHAAISGCRDLLDRFGGHAYAAGLSLPLENLEAFRARFEQMVRERITPEQRVPSLRIDAELKPADINPQFYRILRQFEPFGPGNPSPVFASRALQAAAAPRVLKEEHLKLQLRPKGAQPYPASALEGIAFGQAHALELCARADSLALAYHLEENTWQGRSSLQLQVKSIKRDADVEV
jgi:single-stranded-DNA-specific exonuclease